MSRNANNNSRINVYRVTNPSLMDEDLVKDYEKYEELNDAVEGFVEMSKISFGDAGTAYIKQTVSSHPSWQEKFFKNRVSMNSTTNGVAMISRVEVDGKQETYVVSFGLQGRHIIKGDMFDDRFGLKTALNMIDSKTLKQIGKNELTGSNRVTQQQISTGTTIAGYEFDPFGDYIKSIVGNALPEFGIKGALKGSASLAINKEVDIDNINDALCDITRIYRSDKYKEEFEWIDYLYPVTSKAKKEALYKAAIEHLNKRDGNVWFAVPELFDVAQVGYFAFGGLEMNDILFDEILEEEGGELQVSDLNRDVRAYDNENGNLIKAWKLRKCLCGEVELNGEVFGASDGNWFKVDKDYSERVNEQYLSVELYDGAFDDFDNDIDTRIQKRSGKTVSVVSEGAYLKRMADTHPSRFVLMDGDTVMSMEVCDLVAEDALIHAKRYRSSDTMSHAFFQGLNSATMLVQDAVFLERANGKIHAQNQDSSFLIDNGRKKDIVFAIITKDRSDRPHLPLFSKISLMHAISRLKAMGYKGKLAAIHIRNEDQ